MGLRHALWAVLVLMIGGVETAYAHPSPATIQGAVYHAETSRPLQGVHVFLAGTTTGTTTDAAGAFSFQTRTRGVHRLYISKVGYAVEERDLFLTEGTTHTFHVELTPTIEALDEVQVKAERDEDWHDNVAQFEDYFIGPTPRADSVTLLNPEALQFETRWWGRFRATATEPLQIENRALGYRVRYHLEWFERRRGRIRWDGEPFFEPLEPTSSEEADRWKANRREAFLGSYRHFMLALLYDQIDEEGFAIHLERRSPSRMRSRPVRRSVDAKQLVEATGDSTFTVQFRGTLHVKYHEAPESPWFVNWRGGEPYWPRSYQLSRLELEERRVVIDLFGKSVDPHVITVYGHFAYHRVADALPLGFLPADYDDSPFPRRTP